MLESCLNQLTDQKLRRTKNREALLAVLHAAPGPLSPPEIVARCHQAGRAANKTTIYRDLEAMERAGIVRKVIVSDRKQYFELTERGHHHHLVCITCDRVEDITLSKAPDFLKQCQSAMAGRGFAILEYSTQFLGTCKKCT